MGILESVVIFLSTVVILLAVMVAYLAYICEKSSVTHDEQEERIEELIADNKLLLTDYITLQKQNEKQESDYQRLTAINEILLAKIKSKPPTQEVAAPKTTTPITADASKERLSAGNTNTYRCEDYRKLNLPGSEQLNLQQICHTEYETGLRYYTANGENYYCAALAGAYGSTIGDTWRVTLQNGYEFGIIFADYKHPNQILYADPNDFGDADRNYDGEPTTSVIEFVYDEKIAPKGMIEAGTMSYFLQFGGLYGDGGNIVKMEFLGRKWKP